MATQQSIDQLNSFLRGEMSAVETYEMALDKLDAASPLRTELVANMRSHQERVRTLHDAIVRCGGEPAEDSGPWGVFAKAVEGGATVFGDKAAIAALEQGEDHGLADYRRDVDALDAELQSLVIGTLAPAQQMTHDRMSSLKDRLAS